MFDFKKKSLINSVAIVLVFVVMIFFFTKNADLGPNISDIKMVHLVGQDLEVELAITSEEHARGLSSRDGLAEDKAMLFVFDRPSRYYFWMKDMNFSIDMIWIDEDMNVVYIKSSVDHTDYLATYGPAENSLYVLETVAGFADKYKLEVGDKIYFKY